VTAGVAGMTGELRRALERLASRLGPRVTLDHPLGALTTYRVGGPAAALVDVSSEQDVVELRAALGGAVVPVLVLGKGSNLLVADAGFPGLVVRPVPGGEFGDLSLPPEGARSGSELTVRAGTALGMPVLARRSVEAGLTGLEWAVGIPGSVGGALRMNAGGHGSDIAACLRRYRWIDVLEDAGGEDGPERLALSYRASALGSAQLVVWADLAAAPGRTATGREAIAEIVRWRREHQPGGSNAGSVFTNPPGDAAGRLVEAAGLKGFRIGSAEVSTKHANFIMADEGGSADDVRRLIDHVRTAVAVRFGVILRPEVKLVGFADQGESPAGPRDPAAPGTGEVR
jgi:UDP-N-acetylmuramate dehydrogenase